MKHFLLFSFFLITTHFGFSQQQQLYVDREVKEMAIFPGCEHIKKSKKNELNQCMAQKLTELLTDKLEGFDFVMQQHGISYASARVQFVISKEGVILNVTEVKDSNSVLAQASINALNQIAIEIPPIKPAKLKNGKPVNIFYQLPITYQIDSEEATSSAHEYPVDEIVLFTLVSDELNYEVRFFKNRLIKVYEIKDGVTTFLGKFLSMSEVESSEPYKSLIENERKKEKTLMAEGSLDDGDYEMYIHNLFQKDKKSKPIFVEIVRKNDEGRQTIQNFEREGDFNNSKYAPPIYRE